MHWAIGTFIHTLVKLLLPRWILKDVWVVWRWTSILLILALAFSFTMRYWALMLRKIHLLLLLKLLWLNDIHEPLMLIMLIRYKPCSFIFELRKVNFCSVCVDIRFRFSTTFYYCWMDSFSVRNIRSLSERNLPLSESHSHCCRPISFCKTIRCFKGFLGPRAEKASL